MCLYNGGMVSRLIRFVSGLLLCLLTLLLFGTGAGVLFDAVKYHVLPVVLHVAADRVTVLENPTEVNPDLEGEMVEIVRTPVRCDAVLEDAAFGVNARAAVLKRCWRRGEGNGKECPDEVDGFPMCFAAAAPEFRMGPYRIMGEQALELWSGDNLSAQPQRVPAALAPYRQEGEQLCILLPEAGVQELAYYAVEDGMAYSFIGRQTGDTLVYDEEAARMVYLRQWWWEDSGKVWEDVWAALPGLGYAWLLFAGASWVLRLGVSLMTGDFELYRVSFLWPPTVLLLGLLAAEICFAAGNRAGISGGEDWGNALSLVTLAVLIGLCLMRRKVTAPAP